MNSKIHTERPLRAFRISESGQRLSIPVKINPERRNELKPANVTNQIKREKYAKQKEARERSFFSNVVNAGLPVPYPEHHFALHLGRRWRFDFAFPKYKIYVEVQGGAFSQGGGRHNRGAGLRNDYEKFNTAARLGWRAVYVLPEQLDKPELIETIQDMINGNCTVKPVQKGGKGGG